MSFPQALRERRRHRRLSQLELAIRAGTTQRHVSFLESGRSEPGRAMVVRLAESLELPLRERNDLLTSAGYAPVYPRTSLDDPALAAVRTAIEHVLAAHMPFPALVVDRHGVLVTANDAFGVLTEGMAPELLEPPVNAYRIALHPDGLAPRVANFEDWARHVLDGLRNSLERAPDERLAALHAELTGYVGPRTGPPGALGFAVPLQLRTPDGEMRLMTTMTTFATATDVTIAELRLEAFLPVDEATAALLAKRAAGRPPAAGAPAGVRGR